MDKRLMLSFALIFVVLLLLQPQLSKYFGGKNPPATTSPQAQPPSVPAAAPASRTRAKAGGTAAVGTKEAAAEQQIVVENDVYRITFTNKGAQAKSWILKQYLDDKGRPLELVPSSTVVDVQQDGQTVQLPAAVRYGYPMSYFTYDEGLRNRLNAALYVISTQDSKDGNARTVTFEYASQGISARKSFTFDLRSTAGVPDPNRYVVKAQSQVTQNGQGVAAFLSWPAAGFGDQTVPASFAAARIDTQFGDKVTRLDAKKVSSGATDPGPFNWAGAADQYFGAVFMPDQPSAVNMVTLHNEVAIPKNPEHPNPGEMNKVPVLGAAFGSQAGVTSGRWFVGPKAVSIIDNIKSTPASGQA